MHYVLEFTAERVTIDKQFVEREIITPLRTQNIRAGTIKIEGFNELRLDPNYVFNYENKEFSEFKGRYDLVLMTEGSFDSADPNRTARIDLSGSPGKTPTTPTTPPKEPKSNTGGIPNATWDDVVINNGDSGGDNGNGDLGGPGNDIRIYCARFGNIEVLANGGAGGNGGTGGTGGEGGDGAQARIEGRLERLPAGFGGPGGRGGNGNSGGDAGTIKLIFCESPFVVTDRLHSNGGKEGIFGSGGLGGLGGFKVGGGRERSGDNGRRGTFSGFVGLRQTSEVRLVDFNTLRIEMEKEVTSHGISPASFKKRKTVKY